MIKVCILDVVDGMRLSQRLFKAHEISSSQRIGGWSISMFFNLLRQTIEMLHDQQGVLVGNHLLPLIFQ